MKKDFIVQYCKTYYPDEIELIARSMMNYYHIRNKEDKSDIDIKYQNLIYAGVIKLFEELARILSNELEYEENDIFETLFSIHVKS